MTKSVRKLIQVIPFVALLPYLILAFFTRPAADDLTPNFYTNRYGIFEMCKQTYLHLSGRFFSMSVFLSLTSMRTVFSNYFLIPLCLMLLFMVAAGSIINTLNKYYFKASLKSIELASYAVTALLIYLAVIPDVASSFYWMAAGIIYQLPLMLFMFFISAYIVFINTGSKKYWGLSAILIFLIFGSNEVMIFLLYPVLVLFTIAGYYTKSAFRHYTMLLVLIGTVSAAILLLSPATNSRTSGLTASPGAIYAFSAGLIQYLMMITTAFSTPVFWSILLFLIFNLPPLSLNAKSMKGIALFASAILGSCLVAYFIVFIFKENGLPGRANNLFTFFFLLSMFLYGLTVAVRLRQNFTLPTLTAMRQVSAIVLMITIFTNFNYKKAFIDLGSGFVFSHVYDKRIDVIKEAIHQGKQSVELMDYDYYWNDFVDKNIPALFNKPFKKLIPLYPKSIFICDDLAEKDWDNGFAEYYNIDTIFVNKKRVLRHAIVKNLQK